MPKELQACAVFHGRCDGADHRPCRGGFQSFFPKTVEKEAGAATSGSGTKEADNAMVLARILFGWLISFSLGSDHMQKQRP